MKKFSPVIDLSGYLKQIDYFVLSLILLGTFSVVIWGHFYKSQKKNDKNFIDYMLMGRKLTLPMFVATLVATWYGGIFGVSEIAFESGLYNFLIQGIFWYLTYLIFAFFLVKPMRRYNAITLPELAGQMFGPKSKIIAAFFNFFNVVPITYTISLGLLVKLMTGLDLFESCLLGVLFACAYSVIGGFRAVVLSDVLQFFVMCSAVFLVLVYSLFEFGFSFLTENLPSSHFHLTGKNSLLTTFSWGFIALSTLVDPNFYQRCFAAKDTKTAQNGIFIATGIWCLFYLCTTFGAMYAAAVIPQAKATEAYLIYSLQLLPVGLRGFFLAGVIATILSTIDSYLFIAANTLTYDLAPKKWKENLFISKLGVLTTGFLSVVMALVFSGSIKDVWKTLGSYSAGYMLLPMTIGYIKKDLISDKLFVFSTMSSALGITYWRWAKIDLFDDLYIGLIISALCILLGRKKFV